jgi:predicted acylesterase/phospholipase RssA
MRFPLASGASSGSLCAAGIAAGRAHEMPALWRSLGGRKIVSFRRWLTNRSPFDMSTIVRTTLRNVLGEGDLRAAPGEALVVATRARGLQRLIFSSRQESDFVEPLLGSCFFPVFYGRAIRVRGDLLLDGGVTDNLPLQPLVDRGCTEVIAVTARADGTVLRTLRDRRWRPTISGARLHHIHPLRPLAIGSWDLSADNVNAAVDAGYAAARAFLG